MHRSRSTKPFVCPARWCPTTSDGQAPPSQRVPADVSAFCDKHEPRKERTACTPMKAGLLPNWIADLHQLGQQRRGDRARRGRGKQRRRSGDDVRCGVHRCLQRLGRGVTVLQGPVDAGVDHLRDAESLCCGLPGVFLSCAEGRERTVHVLGGLPRGPRRLCRDDSSHGDVRAIDKIGLSVHDRHSVGGDPAGIYHVHGRTAHDLGGLDDLRSILRGLRLCSPILLGEALSLLRERRSICGFLGCR
mmetsp:Transcript_19795/g.59240  ORF Transcript_19795/g.59240 Transcript_19795/m.59240 type:complete len:246 (-) Transcript_19795:244-981(-)